jgi:flagellar protein FliL
MGWLVRGHAAGGSPPAGQSGAVLHLEPFVINLADPEQRSYLRVGIDLEIGNRALKEDERAATTARARDTILGVLTERAPDELLSADGKTKLKLDLAHALQQSDPELQVEEVYFTEFLVQR